MNRRFLISAMAALPFASSARADGADWQARLVRGDSANGELLGGLHIKLSPGWKTYWRVPGEAGIPPQVLLAGGLSKSFEVEFPTPRRIADEGGEAIGYLDEVLLPLRFGGVDSQQTKVSAFFGVCHDICKPAKFSGDLTSAVYDPGLIAAWLVKVPQKADFVSAARQEGKTLVLTLTQPCTDIFVEGPPGTYFRRPHFDGSLARLEIDGLQADESLQGKALRLTAISADKGLEQTVTLA